MFSWSLLECGGLMHKMSKTVKCFAWFVWKGPVLQESHLRISREAGIVNTLGALPRFISCNLSLGNQFSTKISRCVRTAS